MHTWIESLFGTTKPVVAMLHLMALPGDPHYDEVGGMSAVIERAERELDGLQSGGVDAIMFSNEFSLPYLTRTEPLTAIAMARVIGQLKSKITVPHGVNVLWDGSASIDLAKATDAFFVREIFTGVYASDFGLWNTNVGEVARHRHRIGADHIKLFFNIVPESAQYLAGRDLAAITRSTVFATGPDALCVSGLTAGAPTDLEQLTIAKQSAGATPVFVNTGVNATNIADQFAVADGAVIGSFFKVDGVFENEVDPARVALLMDAAKAARK
ncbi:MAG: BtpA/SgcQ family protein [Propionibacteriaceae bacterium]|nr:BtpA/SgcQ family protein [Propionibacteriaceae bacterium]